MKCKVTCIANHGIMLEHNNTKIMIDAIQEGSSEYVETSKETIDMLKNNTGEFKDVSALLFTHSHKDHFSSELVDDIMSCNERIYTIIDELGGDELKKRNSKYFDRVVTIPYSLYRPMKINTETCHIMALPMPHYGRSENKIYDVYNFSYIITISDVKIFISGDGEASEENFKNYSNLLKDIDIAVLCFPYIFTPKAQKIVIDFIKPKQIIVNHIPSEEKDIYKIIPQLKKYYQKHKEYLPPTIFFNTYMDTFIF